MSSPRWRTFRNARGARKQHLFIPMRPEITDLGCPPFSRSVCNVVAWNTCAPSRLQRACQQCAAYARREGIELPWKTT